MTTPGPISPDNLLLFTHEGVTFDQKAGAGAVPDVENIAYAGFVVTMRPSIFLALCPELPRETEVAGMFDGQPLGMGFLVVRESHDGMWIRGHEGRHRMAYLMDRCGDVPMPVAVLPDDGSRARHITRSFVERLVSGAVREGTRGIEPGDTVRGPLFDRIIIQGKDIPVQRKFGLRHSRLDGEGFIHWTGTSLALSDGLTLRLKASVDPFSIERDIDGSAVRADLVVSATFPMGKRPYHPHGDQEVIDQVTGLFSTMGSDVGVTWASKDMQLPDTILLHADPSLVDALWPELQPAVTLAPSI